MVGVGAAHGAEGSPGARGAAAPAWHAGARAFQGGLLGLAPAAMRGAESPGTVTMARPGWPSGTMRSRPPRDSEGTDMPRGSPLRHRARM